MQVTQPPGVPVPDTGVKGETTTLPHVTAKQFSRNNGIPRTILVRLGLPKLLPDIVFEFKLRLALSKEFQSATELLAARPAAEVVAAQKGQILGEVCDLLQEPPTGFADWPENDNRNPGLILQEYVTQTSDPDARFILETLISGVSNLYWAAVTPREFPAKA